MPPDIEIELVVAAEGGDRVARDELVRTFMPAIAGVARHYHQVSSVQRGELIQEGVVGLLTAAGRFDPSLGTPFWAYASWWVRQAMQQLVAEVSGPVVLSDRAARLLARIREARRVHRQLHGREPSVAELSAATGLTREQVENLVVTERAPRALEEPLVDGEGGTLGEMLADPVSEDAYERVLERTRIEHVRDVAEVLDDRERIVVFAHYGLGCSARTLKDIAGELALSVERVRQLEERALDKLRAVAAC